MMNIEEIIRVVKEERPSLDERLIRQAYLFAQEKHANQKRLSGQEYITHPLAVAQILAEMKLDETTIAAALLHDIIEDSPVTPEEIEKEFGPKIRDLVEGVTILGEIDFSKLPNQEIQEIKFQHEIENLRRFFLAMAKDIRVVIIKLADRLHNMRTLEFLPVADQKRIARETLEIFAPLADRLSMGQMKAELEDLAFKYSNLEEYKKIEGLVSKSERERRNYLSHIQRIISNDLEKENVQAQTDGRIKHLYSIYKKLNKVNHDFSKIYDLLAIRVVVETVEDCYKVMGIIHARYKPMIYLIKDYIAIPKPNGYQSLHTTVFGIKGKITEIQIRTKRMHEEAERGVAAHWHYNEEKMKVYQRGESSFAPEDKLGWVNKLANWQKNVADNINLAEELQIDLFNDRIFVFSPKGNIFDLPEGATPIDFAYELHSAVGNRCRGAKVNGRMVNLNYQLNNRDVVQIILAPKKDKSGPARDWLEYVKTVKAKQKIKNWLRQSNREESTSQGSKILLSELKVFGMEPGEINEAQKNKILDETNWRSWEDLLSAIGEGSLTAKQIVKKIVGQKLYDELESKKEIKPQAKNIEPREERLNLSGILVRYGECCKPKKGDKVKGFITQGQGVTIHKANCHSLLTSSQERIVEIDFDVPSKISARVEISGTNRVGLVRDITTLIAKENIVIDDLRANNPQPGVSYINLTFSIENPDVLTELLPKLSRIEGIRSVRKK
ncbi:MAG: bifunctional (p)ppGpp synthetase/guanosine-3',5'-bis(diphosphate) 3'-pyrophosphohydrolase [bacterium]